MANFFDQFDQADAAPAAPQSGASTAPAANFFDQFDAQKPAPAPAISLTDRAIDLGRSALSGLDKGVAGIAGLPADAASLGVMGSDWLQSKASGRSYDQVKAENDKNRWIDPSTLAKYGSEAFHRDSGLAYEPQTTAGKYADTVSSFVPGAALGPGSLMRRFMLGAGVPGGASEAAGQAAAAYAPKAEPYARIGAALASPMIAARAITPLATDAARIPLTNTLEAAGVPLTAGQRTGNRPLQYMESVLSETPFAGGGAERAMEAQREGFNRAVGRGFGAEAPLMTPEVMADANTRIGGTFRDLAARNTLQADRDLAHGIAANTREYGNTMEVTRRPIYENMVNNIADEINQGGGALSGARYQEHRSRLGRMAEGTTDPEYGRALRGLRDQLDAAMERSLAGTPDAGAWGEARRQYGNMKDAEKALKGAGVETAEGNVSPAAFRSAVASRNAAAYVRGIGDTAELARAGAAIAPLPNSGTAPRLAASSLLSGLSGLGAAAISGGLSSTGMAAAAAGATLPAIAGRAIMSNPMQAYLGNRLIDPRVGGLLGSPAPGLRVVQGYEDSRADPLQLRVRPAR